MPSVVPLYKRSRRSRETADSAVSAIDGHHHHHKRRDPASQGVKANLGPKPSQHKNPNHDCLLCSKAITFFEEKLSCGHAFHGDCVWRWLKSRTNRPEEKSICPTCGFLEPPMDQLSQLRPVRRHRKNSTSSSSSSSSSESDSSYSSRSSTSSSSSSSSGRFSLFSLF